MRRIFLLLALLISWGSYLACATKMEKPALPGVPFKELKPFPGEPWQLEWEKTLAEAGKEGRVLIYLFSGITPSTRQELSQAVKSKYGLELEIIAGRATELAERAIREYRVGLYLADVYIGGAASAVARIKPGDVLQPIEPFLILPEVKEPKVWWGEKLPFADREKLIIAFSAYPSSGLDYNADFVSKEDLKSYRDLLNAKWKGKIVMSDPTIGGSGGAWVSNMGLRVMGVEYLKELARQELVFTRDLRIMLEWMARGKYPIGIGASSGSVAEMRKMGIPLYGHTPKEGSYLTAGGGNLAIFKKPPHPNATRLFANWLLSKEGQTIFSKSEDRQSARIDVPTDFLTPEGMRQPGISYFDARGEEVKFQQDKDIPVSREIFGIK